jgi:hypothetical protein
VIEERYVPEPKPTIARKGIDYDYVPVATETLNKLLALTQKPKKSVPFKQSSRPSLSPVAVVAGIVVLGVLVYVAFKK